MRLSIPLFTVVLALGASACGAPVEEEEGRLAAASEAQLTPDMKDYLVYSLTQAEVQVGKVLVARTTGGGYTAGTEYWYMYGNVSMGSSLTFTSGSSQYWSTPPSDLGTLSFTMAQ